MQYKDNDVEYGSRGASLSLVASVRSENIPSHGAVILRWNELKLEEFEKYAKSASGLLIIIPAEDEKMKKEEVESWNEIERYIVSHSLSIPIFFAYDSEDIRRVEKEASGGISSAFDECELSVSGLTEAPFVKDAEIASVHGWLKGLTSEVDAHLPTIAIVANYDSLSAIPSLAKGANSNGSGVVAVLELARLFSKIYRQPRSRVAFNFLFVLTGASKFNYAGTKFWIERMERDILDRIDFVLCLDSIASEDLHLHFSRPAKTEKTKKVYDLFVDNAKNLGINLSLNRKKGRISYLSNISLTFFFY